MPWRTIQSYESGTLCLLGGGGDGRGGPIAPIATSTPQPGRTATVLGWGATHADAAGWGALLHADARALDSGGPLISGGQVIGLVSWGEGSIRPGAPSVFSRVRVDF